MEAEVVNVLKVFVPSLVAFFIGMALTPVLTHYLYKYKAWKKEGGKYALDGGVAHEFNKLHAEGEVKTPRMGGIIIWVSILITTLGIALLAEQFPYFFENLDFFSRSGTWIPLATLMVGSLVGLMDDLYDILPKRSTLKLRYRLAIVVLLSLFIGWWFYEKLGVAEIGIPFADPLFVGWLIIPLFILVSLALYASGVIDGIDGLSGGVFIPIFASYGIIAFSQGQVDVAAFSATTVGALLAFLWFNIPPARFYMTDTGTMGLTLTIAVLAFMTDSLGGGVGIAVLPIIGGILVVTVLSNILQVLSKKVRGKKLFKIAPLHHHFEAIGWPSYKVVMRFWVIGAVLAIIGTVIALI
ncbi:MAG: hypothetical protein WD003_00690 [Candidatus Paceibacterota bacterium]